VPRYIVLLISASIAGALTLIAPSGAATTGQLQRQAPLHFRASDCSGKVYPAYTYAQSGYFTSSGVQLRSNFDIIKMPSYSPVGEVIGQWPVGCAAVYRAPVTIYLFVSSGPLVSVKERLPLAKESPIRSECLKAVTPTADGNDYPLRCSGDRVNVAAWESYAELLPRLFTLGRGATRCQVYEAEVRPALSREELLSLPEVEASYELASAYYGWKVDVPSLATAPTAWESRCAKN
jgi:hypothetical protein